MMIKWMTETCKLEEMLVHERSQLLQTDMRAPDRCTEGGGEVSTSSGNKPKEMTEQLIPGLSDDIAVLCLARVARGMVPILSAVSKSWRAVVKASNYPSLRQQVNSSLLVGRSDTVQRCKLFNSNNLHFVYNSHVCIYLIF